MSDSASPHKWKTWIVILVLVALLLPSHVIGIERVVTVDEPWWVISGSNYYYALTHRDFENTLYDYHPAVTTTWMVTAGMFSYFPEYRGLGQGYFDVRKPKFEEFMQSQGKQVIDLVRNSRLFQTALLAALAVVGFLLLQKLVGQGAALLSILLAVNAPFFLGHSRLLNHEGMLSMFGLVSLLGMQVYLNRDRKLIYLLISGASFGLAQLTKSSSVVMLGAAGLMLLVDVFKTNGQPLPARLWISVRSGLIWLAAAAVVYFLLWPGMWVAPLKMISGVYGNAFSYAFQGARLDVTEELQPSSFRLAAGISGMTQYLRNWLSTSTPVTWLGLIFVFLALFTREEKKFPSPAKSTAAYLAVLGGLFIAMFGIAQGRNAQHYITSSYVCFDVMAGIGWMYAWNLLRSKWAVLNRAPVAAAALLLLAVGQIGFGLPYAPYYFTYRNFLASRGATIGYGEGLDQAAEYLAQKPNAQEIQAYVYNGMGTFSYFFPGKTLVFKRVYLVDDSFDTITADMQASDYLVLYPITREQQPETEKILGALQNVEPEKIIYINGLEYIRIYKISDIPASVYDTLNDN